MSKRTQDQRVPIMSIASAPRLLKAAGAEPAELAMQAELNPPCFDDPLKTISFEEMGRYLAMCTAATGDDSFSFRVGLAEGPSALSTLGYLVMNTANVRGALAALSKYLYQFAGDVSVTQSKGLALFTYSFRFPALKGAEWIVDAAMGFAISLMRALCGPSWSPVEASFVRALPSRPADWQRHVRAPVYFGAESNLIVFSARWLDQAVERADPGLRRLLLDKVAELEARADPGDVERIATLIRSCVLAGEPTLDEVASRLAISTATLKRRLRAAGTSFQELLDKTRFEMACHLLRGSGASMAQITDVLGYGHASTLSRAFMRWSGMSPRQWRIAGPATREETLP